MSRLEVTVVRAERLIGKDVGGKSDPYVVISSCGQKLKTPVVKSNLNPVWNSHHVFENVLPNSLVQFDVFDKDLIGSDDRLGTAGTYVSRLGPGRNDIPLKLVDAGKEAGILYVTMHYFGAQPVATRAVAQSAVCADPCAAPPVHCSPVEMRSAPPPPVYAAPPPAYAAPVPQALPPQTVFVEDDRTKVLRSRIARVKSKWEADVMRDRAELQDLLRDEQRLERLVRQREADLRAREAELARREAAHHRARPRHHGRHRGHHSTRTSTYTYGPGGRPSRVVEYEHDDYDYDM